MCQVSSVYQVSCRVIRERMAVTVRFCGVDHPAGIIIFKQGDVAANIGMRKQISYFIITPMLPKTIWVVEVYQVVPLIICKGEDPSLMISKVFQVAATVLVSNCFTGQACS